VEAICGDDLEFPPGSVDVVSDEACKLIVKMLSKDPDERPSADEVLSSPWFVDLFPAPDLPKDRFQSMYEHVDAAHEASAGFAS
jgi:serine/threonine protein kinase